MRIFYWNVLLNSCFEDFTKPVRQERIRRERGDEEKGSAEIYDRRSRRILPAAAWIPVSLTVVSSYIVQLVHFEHVDAKVHRLKQNASEHIHLHQNQILLEAERTYLWRNKSVDFCRRFEGQGEQWRGGDILCEAMQVCHVIQLEITSRSSCDWTKRFRHLSLAL